VSEVEVDEVLSFYRGSVSNDMSEELYGSSGACLEVCRAVWERAEKGILTMCHETAKVASHNAMPCRALPLVELVSVCVRSDSSMQSFPEQDSDS
jgi:hypothetical protein